MWETVLGEDMILAVPHRGIVNYRIEMTECIDAIRYRRGSCNRLEVTLDHRLGLWQRPVCVVGACGVAGVQDHLMALSNKLFARHET
jgi:hypothetical protein